MYSSYGIRVIESVNSEKDLGVIIDKFLSLYHGLSASTEDNPLAKTRGLSLCTGGQTMV